MAVSVRPTSESELPLFIQMESDNDTSEFLVSNTPAQHHAFFQADGIEYLTIFDDESNQIFGFFILSLEPDNDTVEFRRIVIAQKGKGHGQKAIRAMENYCVKTLKAKKIWLDVFEANKRGQHIYEKLGYQFVRSEPYDGKTLKFYEKNV